MTAVRQGARVPSTVLGLTRYGLLRLNMSFIVWDFLDAHLSGGKSAVNQSRFDPSKAFIPIMLVLASKSISQMPVTEPECRQNLPGLTRQGLFRLNMLFLVWGVLDGGP